MLERHNTALVIVDVQEKLVKAMYEKDRLVEQTARLVNGALALNVPILCTEQNPAGLGPTIPEIAELLSDVTPIHKTAFSCCGEPTFVDALSQTARKKILLAGIECHVCVYQSVMELVDRGLEVQVVADAISSRTPENKQIGLDRCTIAGGTLTSVETALFELVKVAEGDDFKKLLKIVK